MIKSEQNGVLKDWGDNHGKGEIMTFSGLNDPKEETRVNDKSPQRSRILTIKGYYVLAQLHLHQHSFQEMLEEG